VSFVNSQLGTRLLGICNISLLIYTIFILFLPADMIDNDDVDCHYNGDSEENDDEREFRKKVFKEDLRMRNEDQDLSKDLEANSKKAAEGDIIKKKVTLQLSFSVSTIIVNANLLIFLVIQSSLKTVDVSPENLKAIMDRLEALEVNSQ